MRVKYPSLELNWLPKPKWISLPLIVWNIKESGYLGAYYHPKKKETIIGGEYYSMDNGIIELCSDDYESTLAHEFRHHLQYYLWRKPDIGHDWVDMKGTYKQKIIQYFSRSETELDALLFEVNNYPDDTNCERLEWIIKHYEDYRKHSNTHETPGSSP